MDKQRIGLYVHIPFCAKKCPYCDFFSKDYCQQEARRYTQALCRRMEQFSATDICADTLYLGGGTPSLLQPTEVEAILLAARRSFSLCGEITMEANPNTLNPTRLAAFRRAGINRLSIGIQSLCAQELAALGRRHTAAQAIQAVTDAAKAGFDNISVDLMLGIPYQTKESLQRTLEAVVTLPVMHISAYLLKVEDGTAFHGSPILAYCPDEDVLSDLYLQTVAFLNSHGFLQYEISNFARRGFQSRHNLKYWNCFPYLGIGAAAHSYFKGKRFYSAPDVERFCTAVEQDDFSDLASAEEEGGSVEERLMLALRLSQGVPYGELMEAVRPEIKERAAQYIKMLCNHGLGRIASGNFSLTPEGFLVSNEILSEIMIFL